MPANIRKTMVCVDETRIEMGRRSSRRCAVRSRSP